MKKEDGLGVVLMIFLIVLICAVLGGMFFWYKDLKSDARENSVKSNMLLIQGAGKVSYEYNVMNKTTDKLIGTKLSEVDNNEKIDKGVINPFKQTNTIEEGEYDKYYVLTNEDLANLKLEVKNEEGSYYIIGYEKDEVIITKGYEGKYKLSDINKEDKKDNEEKTEDKQEEQKDEDKQETQEEKTEEEQ